MSRSHEGPTPEVHITLPVIYTGRVRGRYCHNERGEKVMIQKSYFIIQVLTPLCGFQTAALDPIQVRALLTQLMMKLLGEMEAFIVYCCGEESGLLL